MYPVNTIAYRPVTKANIRDVFLKYNDAKTKHASIGIVR